MAEAVYLLCAIASALCAALLLRSQARNPNRLAMWTAVAFVALAANNVLLMIDLAFLPQTDLSLLRDLTALVAVALLLYGQITETV
jgi:hypothetical protein